MTSDKPPISFSDAYFGEPEVMRRAILLLQTVRQIDAPYRPWRKFRHLANEHNIDPVDAWRAAKMLRQPLRPLALSASDGTSFGYSEGRFLSQSLCRLDRSVGGGGPAATQSGPLADEVHRARLRIRTLMDEATESSLIEGAATTRKNAIDLLRNRRTPSTKGERMVHNNYIAMQQIKNWLDRPLSLEMLLELQEILTQGSLDPDESRRLRRADEPVRVEHEVTREVIHVPPPAEQLPERLRKLIDFANTPHEGADFIHPIVKAAILHFMIGYEHPFVDGNGRTARAAFYWQALRSGYNIFEYIPISERIRAGYARYPQAFVDTELDEGDLTYFIVYQLDIINQSLDALAAHLAREEQRIVHSERLLRLSRDLNLRQRLILEHALRHPTHTYTVKGHMNSNGITLVTARRDLDGLVAKKLMTTSKRAREVLYHPSPSLSRRLQRKGL